MEQYVAIDNVCAWPNLTLMPDGSIVAMIFNQPTHGGWEGDVECWASEDEGRTWHRRGVPAPHEPGTNRMNVAAGLARDGALVVIASGYGNRPPRGRSAGFEEPVVLPLWVCRSADGGCTWERGGQVEPPPGSAAQPMPFGDLVQLEDGSLGASLYSWTPGQRPMTAHYYQSQDDGWSWSWRGTLQEGDTNEVALLPLADGRLLAAARTVERRHVELFVSTDRGRTWTDQGPLTLGNQHPAHLLQLADGRLLGVYGIRNQGLYGVGARFSEDQGRTWGDPRVLVHWEGATDGGYPASVQVSDGTVVTAYYCNYIPAHQRYHMGVIRWRPAAA